MLPHEWQYYGMCFPCRDSSIYRKRLEKELLLLGPSLIVLLVKMSENGRSIVGNNLFLIGVSQGAGNRGKVGNYQACVLR